ncbi:Hydroxyacylglutathione hydrolase [compost metagenome]
MDYYASKQISRHVKRITSLSQEFMYLIEGEHEAVLVDTCLGVGNLRAYIENITAKPITVILTHGHVDHAMGAPEFSRVYMSPLDNVIYTEHQELKVRQEYMEMTLGPAMPDLKELNFVPPQPPNFLELKEGDRFDLGGIHLSIFSAAGHTPGTMAILIEEERTLILGDACNHSTFLFDEHSYTVEKYKESLEKLAKNVEGRFDRVYLCHLAGEASREMLRENIKLCDEIINRQTDDVPFTFMHYTCCIAKAVDHRFMRVDGGIGNIIYDINKIFEHQTGR